MEQLSKSRESLLLSLQRKKIRCQKRLFVAEGEKCVEEYIRYFNCRFMAASEQWIAANFSQQYYSCIPVFEVRENVMRKLSSFSTPSPVLGCFDMPDDPVIPEELCDYELLLDNIQDPGNLGTIIRTADWFGFRRIFASYGTVDKYNAKTVQAAMGSCGRVEVVYCDPGELFSRFPDKRVAGLLLDGNDIYRSELPDSAFIVMGNEGNGISGAVREKVTSPLLIPSFASGGDTAESLNVSIATAITLSEFRRR